MTLLYVDEINSPIGKVTVIADDRALCHLDFSDCQDRIDRLLKTRYGDYSLQTKKNLLDMRNRLKAYFAGQWNAFDELQLQTGGTQFQRKVWQVLASIPCGETLSYKQLARRIGQPTAVRAVANANARNPLAIIIPCHRVIASDGSLAGYAGGVRRKQWLLQHEAVQAY